MMAEGEDKLALLKQSANALAEAQGADILVYNYEILSPLDFQLMMLVQKRARRKKLFFLLVTEGGSADSAFRVMRALQSNYDHITVVVPGWCKSAGTLMCVGGHELQIEGLGELGPIDVQIVKADEMDEQKSGLAADAAFEKLQQEAFKFFIGFVRNLGTSGYRVTLRTAFDIATKMTIGVVQPIFDKLEPVTIGEDYRENRLALAYAERLNTHSKNLKRTREFDALEALLSDYQSHGFVIDAKEAAALFKNVKPICAEMIEIMGLIGTDAFIPRSRRQEQPPRMEFLNDVPEQSKGDEAPVGAVAGAGDGPRRRRNRAGDVPGNPKKAGGAAARRGNGKERQV